MWHVQVKISHTEVLGGVVHSRRLQWQRADRSCALTCAGCRRDIVTSVSSQDFEKPTCSFRFVLLLQMSCNVFAVAAEALCPEKNG